MKDKHGKDIKIGEKYWRIVGTREASTVIPESMKGGSVRVWDTGYKMHLEMEPEELWQEPDNG